MTIKTKGRIATLLGSLATIMLFVIPLVFNVIYKSYNLSNIMESIVIGHEKVYYQKMNNKTNLNQNKKINKLNNNKK